MPLTGAAMTKWKVQTIYKAINAERSKDVVTDRSTIKVED